VLSAIVSNNVSINVISPLTVTSVLLSIAVGRKIIGERTVSSPTSVPPEVSQALEEERASIPERVREHSERRIAELDEIGREGESSPSTMKERD
jgi:hypothetical protein